MLQAENLAALRTETAWLRHHAEQAVPQRFSSVETVLGSLREQLAGADQQIGTVRELAGVMAADLSTLSQSSDSVDAKQRVLSAFLQQWHAGSSKALELVTSTLNCAAPTLPPFPVQLARH